MPQYLNTNRMFSLSKKSENPLFFKKENKVLTEAGGKKKERREGRRMVFSGTCVGYLFSEKE